MNKNFDKLTLKPTEIDRKFFETTRLTEDNKWQIDCLVEERDILSTKVGEQDRRVEGLKEQVEDQINKNTRSVLVLRGRKHKILKKSGATQRVLAKALNNYFDWNKNNFIHDTDRARKGT